MSRNTEAFIVYFSQREALTNYLQIGTAAMALLLRNVAAENGPDLLGAFVDACAVKHWAKGKRFPNQIEVVQNGIAEVAHHGVIRHAAAFDNFTRNIVIECARFSKSGRQSLDKLGHSHSLVQKNPQGRWVVCPCCHEKADTIGNLATRLETMQEWLGWRPSPKLADVFPMFHLMRRIRNRIAHYDSMVGADLEDYSESKDVQDSIANFRKHYAKRDVPALPKFRRGNRISLAAVNSILFGSMLYEIAGEVNNHACGMINEHEFIDMAFFYSSIVEEHPYRTVRHRTAEARINYFLDRYLRRATRTVTERDIIDRLQSQIISDSSAEKVTLWSIAVQRHRELLT
ncbi:hypothetical protein [Rhizobium ruizarguesonis]|uniref:hypothetical protein n=1 Tax=Rhizobium ruizarguesonis TaxID=2081791 RepID=UPI0010310109|nr:hypothetical protein [Rhizobium ruizarguesonis]